MDQEIDNIRSELDKVLEEIKAIENPIYQLFRTTDAIDQAVAALNFLAEKVGFIDEKQEVSFFKQVKPELLAMKISEVFRYNLLVNRPVSTQEVQLKYYEEELLALQSVFRMNAFHYQYYKNKMTHLDLDYFLKNAGPLTVPLAETFTSETAFSTPMSYLFAKFIAFEQLQYHILEQIEAIKTPELQLKENMATTSSELRWTGDVINIVELAYGIWLTGQLNDGNASLNQIVRWLEINLHVTIGIIQRRFTEIERRKRLSPTKYIDKMKVAILQKIDSGTM
jgi:hypothetical protein